MSKLAVLVPSRGRPQRLREMTEAAYKLAEADTTIIAGVDLDDPQLDGYRELDDGRTQFMASSRRSLTEWTNLLAEKALDGQFGSPPEFIASLGDDHVPVTQGWDAKLVDAILKTGKPGMAYPEDRRRNDVPEAIVMSAAVVRALGWVCEPSLKHFWVDNVWASIGSELGILQFCPDVVVEHRHYLAAPGTSRGISRDATYAEAEDLSNSEDAVHFQRWREERMAADVERVRRVLLQPPRCGIIFSGTRNRGKSE